MMRDTKASYYPAFIDCAGKRCVVIGGGEIAAGKIRGLLKANADITVISPKINSTVLKWHESGRIHWRRCDFYPEAVEAAFLVIAATDDGRKNKEIGAALNDRTLLFNAVDDPGASNFITPAIAQAGEVQVAVSTAGQSPALAKKLRDRIADEILVPEIDRLAWFLGRWRETVKSSLSTYQDRKRYWERVLDSDIPHSLHRADGEASADAQMLLMLEDFNG